MRYIVILFLINCSFSQPTQTSHQAIKKCGDIPVPTAYRKFSGKDSFFANYLSNLKFKEDNSVLLYNGQLKSNQNAHYKVLNLGVGHKDLQQCADAVIRLRAEYLFEKKQHSKIQFHFTSGHLCRWEDYAEGMRPKINGNTVRFVKSSAKDYSKNNFDKYLDLIYSYCGTASLYKELKSKPIENIEPGDVLIQTGNPYGHAVIVMSVLKNKAGTTLFTIVQSYMPAQEIHVLKNPNNTILSPWYEAKEGEIETPEWSFNSADLKTWGNN